MLLTGFMLVMVSCSPTRYVGKDEYLLNKVKVRVEEKGVNFSELKKTVRQRPNTRILGVAPDRQKCDPVEIVPEQ